MDDGKKGDGENGRSGNQEKERTSPWEWVVAAVSTALVLGAIGFMLYEALSVPPTPPKITVSVDTIIDTGSGYVVEFRARNDGHSTAAGLTVEGELKSDTGSVEKAQATIDYVPPQATRKGGLFFTHDPGSFALEVRPKGYDRP